MTFNCPTFLKLSPQQRKKKIQDSGACYQCLRKTDNLSSHKLSCKLLERGTNVACPCKTKPIHNKLLCQGEKRQKEQRPYTVIKGKKQFSQHHFDISSDEDSDNYIDINNIDVDVNNTRCKEVTFADPQESGSFEI